MEEGPKVGDIILTPHGDQRVVGREWGSLVTEAVNTPADDPQALHIERRRNADGDPDAIKKLGVLPVGQLVKV